MVKPRARGESVIGPRRAVVQADDAPGTAKSKPQVQHRTADRSEQAARARAWAMPKSPPVLLGRPRRSSWLCGPPVLKRRSHLRATPETSGLDSQCRPGAPTSDPPFSICRRRPAAFCWPSQGRSNRNDKANSRTKRNSANWIMFTSSACYRPSSRPRAASCPFQAHQTLRAEASSSTTMRANASVLRFGT